MGIFIKFELSFKFTTLKFKLLDIEVAICGEALNILVDMFNYFSTPISKEVILKV